MSKPKLNNPSASVITMKADFQNATITELNLSGKKGISTLDSLRKLSAVNRIDKMKSELQNDSYIFDGMALSGQISLFYSKPNTGKTLIFMKLLVDAINEGRVEAKNVFYINADDNFKGLLTKAEIAKKYGFEMISPSEANIRPDKIIDMIESLANSGDAKGIVIILDTLKKFADMMSKESQKSLYEKLRKLIAKNATVILAGHANKYPTKEGKLVYEGTADTMNDVDCAYVINLTSLPHGDVTVEFVREKNRGDNVFSAGYTFRKDSDMSYQQMMESVTKVQINNTDKKKLDVRVLLEKYESEILFIKQILKDGKTNNQSMILKVFKEMKTDGDALAEECSEKSIVNCLKVLTGKLWSITRGDNHAKLFHMLPSADEYINIKARG